MYTKTSLLSNNTSQKTYSVTTYYKLLVGPIHKVSSDAIRSFIQVMDRGLVLQHNTIPSFYFSDLSALKSKKNTEMLWKYTGSSSFQKHQSSSLNNSTTFIAGFVILTMESTIYIAEKPESVADIILNYIEFFEPGSESSESTIRDIQEIEEDDGSETYFPFNQTTAIIVLGGDIWKKQDRKISRTTVQLQDNRIALRWEYISTGLASACAGFILIATLIIWKSSRAQNYKQDKKEDYYLQFVRYIPLVSKIKYFQMIMSNKWRSDYSCFLPSITPTESLSDRVLSLSSSDSSANAIIYGSGKNYEVIADRETVTCDTKVQKQKTRRNFIECGGSNQQIHHLYPHPWSYDDSPSKMSTLSGCSLFSENLPSKVSIEEIAKPSESQPELLTVFTSNSCFPPSITQTESLSDQVIRVSSSDSSTNTKIKNYEVTADLETVTCDTTEQKQKTRKNSIECGGSSQQIHHLYPQPFSYYDPPSRMSALPRCSLYSENLPFKVSEKEIAKPSKSQPELSTVFPSNSCFLPSITPTELLLVGDSHSVVIRGESAKPQRAEPKPRPVLPPVYFPYAAYPPTCRFDSSISSLPTLALSTSLIERSSSGVQ